MATTTRPRPRSLPSTTTKLSTEMGNLYVTVSTDEDGEPFEVFGWLGKGGTFQHGVTELACRLISLHLRRGTPVEIQDTIREFEDEKRWVVERLRAWLGQQGSDKAKLQGREKTRSVGLVRTTRYSVDYRRLNNLLDPETRSEIVTENVSEYLRVS